MWGIGGDVPGQELGDEVHWVVGDAREYSRRYSHKSTEKRSIGSSASQSELATRMCESNDGA